MRIVIDISTSSAFRRPAVGIVRTERKFAEYMLSRTDIESSFCCLDRETACYREIDRETARDVLGLVAVAPTEGGQEQASTAQRAVTASARTPATRSLKGRARAVARGVSGATLGRLPGPLQYEAWTTLRGGKDLATGAARFALGCLRLAGSRIKTMVKGSAPRLPGFQFRPDDIYMSMGLDWDFNDLDLLAAERSRVGFKVVLFCYDTIPVHYPHLTGSDFQSKFIGYFRQVSGVADRVIAISETSKSDFLALMQQLGLESPGIDVVPLGTDLSVSESDVRVPDPDLEGQPFVLFVSTIEVRKNHRLLYHVWERLVERHGNASPLLVFVGFVGWGIGDLMAMIQSNPKLKGRIRLFNNLGDGELIWLYRNCLFTAFPSLYEGWGLPVVESLALGKPCLCSTAPAVLEASQGMATAIDPHDLPAWVAGVESLWLDPAAREQAMSRLKAFHAQTWREHGEGLVAIARDLAK